MSDPTKTEFDELEQRHRSAQQRRHNAMIHEPPKRRPRDSRNRVPHRKGLPTLSPQGWMIAAGIASLVAVLGVLASIAFLPWLNAVGIGVAVTLVGITIAAIVNKDFHDLGSLMFGAALIVALLVSVLSAIVNATGLKASLTGAERSGSSNVAPAVAREINKAGAYGFASYDNFQGVKDEGHGDVAIRTSLFDKPENEQVARYMCSSMMTIRLQDGLEDLGQVRILSSADTTLAYCD